MLASSGMALFGDRQLEFMSKLPFMGSIIALSVDGLIPGDQAGTVSVRADGRISLDYPISDALVESFTEAHHVMCKIAMAAGAQSVITTHAEPLILKQGSDLSRLSSKRYGAHEHAIFSAHQMGGCPMGSSPRDSVVDSAMRHHSIHNLFVVDGSALPTALGVNPSETIYALARRAVASVASAV